MIILSTFGVVILSIMHGCYSNIIDSKELSNSVLVTAAQNKQEYQILQDPRIISSNQSLNNLTSLISYVKFKGEWITMEENRQFQYLTKNKGVSYMYLITNSSNLFSLTNTDIIDQIDLQMFDPKYLEGKAVYSRFSLQDYNLTTQTWIGQSVMNYTQYYKFKPQKSSIGKCLVNYTLQVIFTDPNKPSPDNCNLELKVQAQDRRICQVDFTVSYGEDTTNYQLEVIIYCVFVNLICALQFICVTKLCRDFQQDDTNIQRISLITIGIVTIYHSYLCFQNLYFALLNYVYFQYFIIPSFFYFLLSSTCDMKLVQIVWRARYINNIENNQQMRKALCVFFVQFYSAMLIFFVLMHFFELQNLFILSTSLFLVPQIVHNAIRGDNPKFIPDYIFGFLASNMLYPLYFRSCPANFRGMEPSLVFCVTWVTLFFIQMLFLYIQYKFGSRSFIPKFLLPKQFNYYQSLGINGNEEEGADDCAICLGSLSVEPTSEDEINNQGRLLNQTIMVTPCKHKYHVKCLKSWMEVKLTCPTCRKKIPISNEQ